MSALRKRPYYSDSLIERLAREELSKADLLPLTPGPVRIDRFIEKRFGSPIEFDDLPGGVLGLTRFTIGGVVDAIVVSHTLNEDSSDVTRRRLNTTLGHEAGHGLLHAELFKHETFDRSLFEDDSEVAQERILCREPRNEHYDGRWWELQANKMMAALLLPAPSIVRCLEDLLTKEGLTGRGSLPSTARSSAEARISTVFDVNPIAAKYRLDTLFPPSQSAQLTL